MIKHITPSAIIVGLFVLIAFIFSMAYLEERERHKAFYGECLQDKKKYLCDIDWAVATGKAQKNVANSALVGGMVGGMVGSAGR